MWGKKIIVRLRNKAVVYFGKLISGGRNFTRESRPNFSLFYLSTYLNLAERILNLGLGGLEMVEMGGCLDGNSLEIAKLIAAIVIKKIGQSQLIANDLARKFCEQG